MQNLKNPLDRKKGWFILNSLMISFVVIVTFCILVSIYSIYSIYPIKFVKAFLYENGTCTNEKLDESSKQVINTNGTVNDFLKSLPSDNTILAEIVCQK